MEVGSREKCRVEGGVKMEEEGPERNVYRSRAVENRDRRGATIRISLSSSTYRGSEGNDVRTLRAPVVDHADLLRHGKGHEIADAQQSQNSGKETERCAGSVEATSVGNAHALAEEEDQSLVIDGLWIGEEEESEGEVEQGDGGDDRVRCDETHGDGF